MAFQRMFRGKIHQVYKNSLGNRLFILHAKSITYLLLVKNNWTILLLKTIRIAAREQI